MTTTYDPDELLRRGVVSAGSAFAGPDVEQNLTDKLLAEYDRVGLASTLAKAMVRLAELDGAVPWTDVEAWLKARREAYVEIDGERTPSWYPLDAALDDLWEHAQTGTPLDQPVARTEEDTR